MKNRVLLFVAVLFIPFYTLIAQDIESTVSNLPGEKWWGGLVAAGNRMPFVADERIYDLNKENWNNQIVPFLLSSKGRFIWSEDPFKFQINDQGVRLWSKTEEIVAKQGGRNLRDAYQAAVAQHFPYEKNIPEELFFSKPQYNTWIELMYNQNQNDILNYAHKALEHGFPTGILMVDDNWQRYYGNFDFKEEKFANPKAMTDELHQLGFKIMLWISPFVSPDSPEFRELRKKGYLLKDKKGNPAIINWWNGFSACYDMTNPEAVNHFKNVLKQTMERYGVDGFKFDAGDIANMNGDYSFWDEKANAHIFSQRWAEFGAEFPFNELRTTWKTGGKSIIQRLGDKEYSWGAISSLIPDMIAAGLLGFAYTCPDMIGGGQFGSFLNIDPDKFDQELIVRSCQVHAMMPMMQFSVAPWRILNTENIAICAKYAKLHEEMGPYILECARQTALTNVPILRSLEYDFPEQGFIDCKDQFMLGDKYMVAPMLTSGTKRSVRLPKGLWKDDEGKIIKGAKTLEIDVPLSRLPYYERLK
ncbi:glycoside hydrolase family 31 protein [Bacteroides sp.]|uniref:glycoside hydrolase family 31 protein n=1 Tax=Bacteroides sp. TaxID=29523 RepID=UPI0026305D01|nr:glycoside hydrolase family 31 protein [Bacteroides sp.]MDD3036941.1 glycoside hydrolase family 31 protein [Bacteroides sp.]